MADKWRHLSLQNLHLGHGAHPYRPLHARLPLFCMRAHLDERRWGQELPSLPGRIEIFEEVFCLNGWTLFFFCVFERISTAALSLSIYLSIYLLFLQKKKKDTRSWRSCIGWSRLSIFCALQ